VQINKYIVLNSLPLCDFSFLIISTFLLVNISEICRSLNTHYVQHSQKLAKHRGERSLFLFQERVAFYTHIMLLYKPHPPMTPTWECNNSSMSLRQEWDVALPLCLST